jgi:signal transduction histidine kinase
MSVWGAATGGRLDPLDVALGGAVVAGALGTLALIALPDFRGHVNAPALDLAVDSVALMATAVVAVLSWVRYREGAQPIALVQAAAFLALAIADGSAVAITILRDFVATPSLGTIGQAQLFVWTCARLLAAALLVAGGIQSLRGGAPRHPRGLLVGTAALMLLVVGVAAPWLGPGLTSIISSPAADAAGLELEDLTLTTLGVIAQLVGAGLFVGAALVSRLLWRRDRMVGDAYLSFGLAIAAIAQLHATLFPTGHPEQVGTPDLLRLVFSVVLLLGIRASASATLLELRSANDTLARLRDAEVEHAAAEERARLSRELHDGLAQDLWLAKLKIGRLAAVPGLTVEDRKLAEEASEAVEAGLTQARQGVLALRDSADPSQSFAELLESYADDVVDRFGLPVTFECVADLPELSPRSKANILKIAHEALTNAAHHADARTIRMQVGAEEGGLSVVVADDGRGFDPADVASGHIGLDVMRERAAAIGARLAVESSPSGGTRVVLTVPALAGSPAIGEA